MNYKKLNATAIKWIAIVAMIIDHAAWAFITDCNIFAIICHSIGRITGPVMFFFVAEGYYHTGNLKKYFTRLGLFAIISQVPYSLFVNQGHFLPFDGSIMVSLFLGLLALYVYDKVDGRILKWLLIAGLIGVTYWSDWSFFCVIFVLVFGIFREDHKRKWILYWIVNILRVPYLLFVHNNDICYWIPAIIGSFLTFALLMSYNGERGGNTRTKWAFYIIYPLHLLLICLIYLLVM